MRNKVLQLLTLFFLVNQGYSQTVSTFATGLNGSLGGVIMDNIGNVFVSNRTLNQIQKIDTTGNISVYCAVGLNDPMGLAFDTQWNLYVANYNGQVAVIPAGGGIATDYTSGLSIPFVLKQYDGDTLIVQEYGTRSLYKILPGGGVAGSTNVPLLAISPGGSSGGGLGVYNNKDILMIGASTPSSYAYRYDKNTGSVTYVSTIPGYPIDISIGVNDMFFYATWNFHTIRELDGNLGTTSLYAGTGNSGNLNGDVSTAEFSYPYYMCNDPLGGLYISESFTGNIRKISALSSSLSNLNVGDSISTCEETDVTITPTFEIIFYDISTYQYLWTGPNGFTASSSSITLNNVNVLNEGFYVFTVTDINGFFLTDSVFLEVNTITNGIDTHSACNSFIWIDGNTYMANNNSATYLIANGSSKGCDSIVTLNLTIINIDTTVLTTSNTITSNQLGATYQWLDCNDNFAIIPGETNQSFQPVLSGDYAVKIDFNGCIDTSFCVNMNFTGLGKDLNKYVFNIFPNPSNGKFIINVNYETDLELIDLTGQIINFYNLHIGSNDFNLSLSPGIYFFRNRLNGEVIKFILNI